LATNLIRDRAQLFVLLAEFVGLVGVKALQGISNYLGAQSLGLSLEAVTSHEDVVFFDVAIALMVVVALLGLRTKLTYALMALVPVILTAEVLTQRRVGFIALATVVLAMLMVSATVAPRRVLVLAVVGAIAFGAYAAFFWDESGPVAEPLRAIQTVIDPGAKSARDAGSDHWRDIENRNIASTIRQLPLTGVGVGQQYFFQEEPPPLPASFPYWRYITHNAVLWLWLKAGPLGALAKWRRSDDDPAESGAGRLDRGRFAARHVGGELRFRSGAGPLPRARALRRALPRPYVRGLSLDRHRLRTRNPAESDGGATV